MLIALRHRQSAFQPLADPAAAEPRLSRPENDRTAHEACPRSAAATALGLASNRATHPWRSDITSPARYLPVRHECGASPPAHCSVLPARRDEAPEVYQAPTADLENLAADRARRL